jgi:pectate lyase
MLRIRNYKSIFFILFILFLNNCKKNHTPVTEVVTASVRSQPVAPNSTDMNTAFGIAGFATLNGGTDGGEGGPIATVTSFDQLKSHLESPSKNIIKVEGRIYNGNKGGRIKINSNKTLLGIGDDAFLDGIGLTISNTRNIIIQNIKISLVSITDRSDPAVYSPTGDEGRGQILVNGGDAISISNTSSNIWIDHCELYGEDPHVQTNQDLYDGLIDIKNSSAYITISWNYFHDHHKTHLVGSADTDNFDRTITFHHNYYHNVKSRLPLYRFGSAHIYNNYYANIGGSGIDSRMGACIKIENNVFESVKSPIISSGTIQGSYDTEGNSYLNISGRPAPGISTCSFTPPYVYTAENIKTVKGNVTAKAGVGKL